MRVGLPCAFCTAERGIRVAVLFELVVNAGPEHAVALQVAEQLSGVHWLPAGRHRVSLVRPQARIVQGMDGAQYQEVAVVAAGVGTPITADAQVERLELDSDERRELAAGLYELLRHCRGYRAAFVGWDPEHLVDPAALEREWAEELRAGTLHGLVLSDETLARLGTPVLVEPFAPGFSWMPAR